MSDEIKPGTRIFSAVCDGEFIVIKCPPNLGGLTIGGHAVSLSPIAGTERLAIADAHDSGALLGKRYVDLEDTIEILCTKAALGSLALGGIGLAPKESKPLPASD